jgi:hypothetical protein
MLSKRNPGLHGILASGQAGEGYETGTLTHFRRLSVLRV